MAAAENFATNLRKTGIFWNSDDESQPPPFVPGTPFVSGLRNSKNRRGPRSVEPAVRRGPGSGESAMRMSRKRSAAVQRESSGGSGSNSTPVSTVADEQRASLGAQMQRDRSQICLKDLCPEDKKRIANLIQELARMSEEKEEFALRFKDEQGQFEQKILELEEQNVLIAQERESLQQQYRECQELLGLYQLYLRQQQESAVLPQPISQQQERPDTTQHSQMPGAERAPHGAVSVFDGSYLSLVPSYALYQPPAPTTATTAHPPAAPLQRRVHPGPVVPEVVSSLSSGGSRRSGCVSCHCQRSEHGLGGHNGSQRPAQRSAQSEQRKTSPVVCAEDWEQRKTSPVIRAEDWEQRKTSPVVRAEDWEQRRTSPVVRAEDWEKRKTSPVVRAEDWEQKKSQLLMQRMQLEQERERLQRRLTEQEQRMTRQQGLQGNGRAQLECSSQTQTEAVETPRPAVHSCRETTSTEDRPVPELSHSSRDTMGSSKRDAGTSPLPHSNLQPPENTTEHRPETRPKTRMDVSLSELLEIFSPVCPSTKQKSATYRMKTPKPHPCSAGPAPCSFRKPAPQDWEESRILEDIFFIC